jgi:hypothetical protein
MSVRCWLRFFGFGLCYRLVNKGGVVLGEGGGFRLRVALRLALLVSDSPVDRSDSEGVERFLAASISPEDSCLI